MPKQDRTEEQPQSNETVVAIRELTDQLLARQPSDPNNLGLSEAKRRELLSQPPVQKYRAVRCRSEDTGSVFDAIVVESRKHPHGRIVRLEKYVMPDGAFKLAKVDPTTGETTEGLIPGLPIFVSREFESMDIRTAPSHALSSQYKQWRWENFWQKDLRFFIGRGLQPHFCDESGKGLDTPWKEGTHEMNESERA